MKTQLSCLEFKGPKGRVLVQPTRDGPMSFQVIKTPDGQGYQLRKVVKGRKVNTEAVDDLAQEILRMTQDDHTGEQVAEVCSLLYGMIDLNLLTIAEKGEWELVD